MLDRRAFVEHLLSAAAALPLTRDLGAQAAAQSAQSAPPPLRLEYSRAAQKWVEALPIGGGRLGAMVFGGIGTERLQLNDDTLWSGGPSDTGNPKAHEVLPQVRRAVAEGRFVEADTLAKESAERVVTLWARPELPLDQWVAELRPQLSPVALSVLSFVDPSSLKPAKIEGKSRVMAGSPARVVVSVPTSAGEYRVTMSRQTEGTAWVVDRVSSP
jgi:hypothetical protein